MYNLIDLPVIHDGDGSIVDLNIDDSFLFIINRIYYINKVNEHTEFEKNNCKNLIVCLSGYCELILDNGNSQENLYLSLPDQGVIVNDSVLRGVKNFSSDCVLMVFTGQNKK